MVGAGFSRSAASTGDTSKKIPLWNDFSKTLAAELESASTDPLRLAEEYSAYFGKQALHDLIKRQVNDPAWIPGDLHKSLLELPWSEVLTTNWDTLLERASAEVHQPVYSLVSKQEDLSSARSPRIVKLHGTIDLTKELVFTQEDYRKYPQHHAAFVNFSRQVFIENELCLVGFSGDDPNFLQWAGWVRDHLATHSRRIYLVGALGLNSARRKYLESINVAPIDLNDLVADYDEVDIRHREATRLFIQSLKNLKPKQAWEWVPTQPRSARETLGAGARVNQVANQAKLLDERLPPLEADRLSYPGWLVCPHLQRFQLQGQISDPWPTPENLSGMVEESKAKLLYEISWNRRVTYEAIPSWLANEMLKVCDLETRCILTKKQQLEMASFVLKASRWLDSPEAENISQVTTAILKAGEKFWSESSNELAYHNAIVMRDRFDYAALEEHAEKIDSDSPVWKLRKSALFAELGRFDEGETLVVEAYKELLDQYRNDRNSIHLLSRLAWAHWLMRGVSLSSFSEELRAFPSNYRDSMCDPWEHIEHIRDRISKGLDKQQKQQGIEPSFEPGRYRNNSNIVSLSNEVHPLLLLDGVSNVVGMPLRWNGVSFLGEQAARLAELDEIDNVHRFALAIRSASSDTSDVLKKTFSRIRIARFSKDDVSFLLNQCALAIDFWKKKIEKSDSAGDVAIERLRVFIEVMARVSVRATPEQAKEIFRLAVSLGKKSEFRHLWLFDSLRHLSEFSLKSIPKAQQKDILLDALSFPLRNEINVNEHRNWANPIVSSPGERPQDSTLDRRIDEIIDCIAPCSSRSAPALLRLLPLIEKRFLTDDELKKIAEKIWGSTPDLQILPDTGLLKYVLLELPGPDTFAVKALVRRHLFEARGTDLFSPELLMDIANAAQAKDVTEFPSENQALIYFEQLVVWRPKKEDDFFGLSQKKERHTVELVGEVLARSVVPALPIQGLTEDRFRNLLDFYSEVDAPEILIAFVYFAAANETFSERVERLIRQGFQSDDSRKLAYASAALLTWRGFAKSTATDRLILRLVYLMGSNRIIGLSEMLLTVNKMYCRRYLSEENVESLVEILPVIFDNSKYENISPLGRESVSVSFVRAACVRLARDIYGDGEYQSDDLLRILEEARQDALPEVRFAEKVHL